MLRKALAGAALLLSGCLDNGSPKEWTSRFWNLTGSSPVLADCVLVQLRSPVIDSKPTLYIVRCPSSTVSTTWQERQGKHTVLRTSQTIEDVAP